MIPSPNKNDVIWTRDKITEEKIQLQKHHYLFSVRELYECAIQPVELGGCPGFCDNNNPKIPLISISTFEKMMPGNLKEMTDSQKEMCGCDICIDG